jgi:anti-anti-sigma factor
MTPDVTFSARPSALVRTRGPSYTPDVPHASVLPVHSTASPPDQLHGATFTRRWLAMSVALLSAHGDIDATNAAVLTEYVLVDVARCQALVLDLRGLSFCGTEGFVALHRVSVCCAAAGTRWAIVSGPAVSRLLVMCTRLGRCPMPAR